MSDTMTPEQRHKCMSHIRSKNTRPEMAVRKYLFAHGFRYRLYRKDLPGKPDITLPKYKTVIFINGCFWHGHESCKYATIPKSNTDFWLKKIHTNQARDCVNYLQLEEMGWKVITIWECELKKKVFQSTMDRLVIEIISHHKPEIKYQIQEQERMVAEDAADYKIVKK